jgi:hypothetical protein
MDTAPMTRALPTPAQADRIHQLFDEAVAEHPREAELLRGIERTIIQQPDDDGPGLPEPIEPLVQEIVTGVLRQGPITKRKMRKFLRDS